MAEGLQEPGSNPPQPITDRLEELEEIELGLVELLNRRATVVRELMQRPDFSTRSALNPDTATVDDGADLMQMLAADSALLGRALEHSKGPLSNHSLQRLLTNIQAASRTLDSDLTVAYLGPEGTYTQAAVFKHFGVVTTCETYSTIDDVFRAVETGACRFGVAPVENSIEGAVNRTLDCLTESSVHICGEVRLRIEHNLMTNAVDLAAINSVHAHPQALAQCRQWLDSHLPGIERISASSNAAAAQLAVEQPAVAAIAGDIAASLYDLPVLHKNIEDESSNTTRFVVISNSEMPPTGDDSTSLLVSAPHRPGGLRKMLEPFELAGVSMTRIESRPARKALWNYVFFIDVSGHKDDEGLAPALEALSRETRFFRVLGSYPAAVE